MLGRRVAQVILERLYQFLQNNSLFRNAVRRAKENIEAGLTYLKSVATEIIKDIKKNKELTAALTKYSSKIVARSCNTGISIGIATIGKKSATKIANPANVVVDITQVGLEIAGYKEQGKVLGLLGTLGTGACAGFMAAGPAGAIAGALTNAVPWLIGEGVGQTIEAAL